MVPSQLMEKLHLTAECLKALYYSKDLLVAQVSEANLTPALNDSTNSWEVTDETKSVFLNATCIKTAQHTHRRPAQATGNTNTRTQA